MNTLIDCGAYNGDILQQAKKSEKCKGFDFYAIECNPLLINTDYGDGVVVINKAAWIYDGELNLYVSSGNPTNRGSSIKKEKSTGSLDCGLKVQCFDFSKWLLNNFEGDDKIILKMNIEGAEYEVLEKCIADRSIDLIDELYVRWHWNKIGMEEKRHTDLVGRLNATGVKMYTKYNKLLD